LQSVAGSLKITAKTLNGLTAGKGAEDRDCKPKGEKFEYFHYLYFQYHHTVTDSAPDSSDHFTKCTIAAFNP
jgi:hypothetical protein